MSTELKDLFEVYWTLTQLNIETFCLNIKAISARLLCFIKLRKNILYLSTMKWGEKYILSLKYVVAKTRWRLNTFMTQYSTIFCPFYTPELC